jgi:hypothetical protein
MSKKYDFKLSDLTNSERKFERKIVNLDSIDFDELDFESPIQRKGNLWKNKYKKELIGSILIGLPCGTVHLVSKGNEESERWVLDAKQRLLTIESFKNDEFSISILDDKEKKNYEVFWSDIKKNNKWKFLLRKIKEYQMELIIHPHMPEKDMLKLFKSINNQVAPNALEKIYSEYYLTKLFLEYCYETYMADKSFLEARIAEDQRHTGINLFHSILMICNGPSLNDIFSARELSSKKISESAKEIKNKLVSQKINSKTEYGSELIESLGWNKKLDEVKTALCWFSDALRHKNSLCKNKKLDKNLVLDVLCFFIKKSREKILTKLYVSQNYDKISEFISQYWSAREKNKEIKCRSTQISSLVKRIKEMERIFVNIPDINLEAKQKNIKKSQKIEAALNASRHCPLNDLEMVDSKTQNEHTQGAQNVGDQMIVCVDASANRFTGPSAATHQKVAEYQNKYKK